MKWPFFAGLGVGAAIGLLYAPRSGAQVRNSVQQFARDTYDRNRERVEPVVRQARETLEPVIDEARSRVESAAAEVRERTSNAEESASGPGQKSQSVQQETGGLMAILNDWPHERLIEIDGIGPVLASKIIKNRPYESEEDLIESKELPPSAIASLRRAA